MPRTALVSSRTHTRRHPHFAVCFPTYQITHRLISPKPSPVLGSPPHFRTDIPGLMSPEVVLSPNTVVFSQKAVICFPQAT